MFGAMVLAMGFVLITLTLAWTVIGVHALLLGRMPGRWLQRYVRQPNADGEE